MKNKKTFKITPYIFLLPALILMGAFVFLPLIQAVQYSFFKFENFRPISLVKFDNYITLFHDSMFWDSIVRTLQWAFMSAIIPGFVGLVLAFLLEYRTRNRILSGVSRTILFMPMMMSMVAVGLLWSLIYNPLLGLISGLFNAIGITSNTNPIDLLGNKSTAMIAAFATTVWYGSGFSMVIFSAAIQGIPKDIIEAAMIDGTNKFQQIRYISIPYILRTIIIVLTVNMISGFKAFDILYVLTNGGPSNATNITSLYLYRQAFFAFKFDYASAISVVLFICVVFFVVVVGFATDRINKRFG